MRDLTEMFRPTFDRRPFAVRPYVIAEAGVNHEGSMELAKLMVHQAAEAGADAIKFQTYKAESLAVRDSPAYWDVTKEPTRTQYELFKRHDSFWLAEFEELRVECDRAGIAFMSTPFDVESARFLDDLVDVHKISSSDLTNKPFVELIASFGKPILLSTGASTTAEIDAAVGWVRAAGAPLSLLHCVLNYPTAEEDADLGRVLTLARSYPDLPVGYSDHTVPADLEALVLAASLGAVVIEKHFTHDVTLQGNDHYHAMDAGHLRRLIERFERSRVLIGDYELGARDGEESARKYARRSLVAAVDITRGTQITAAMLTWKRPATGISPAQIDAVIGKRAATDIASDTTLMWDHLT